MIASTIAGLALAALIPTARPAPGLSRTPRKAETSAVLAFEVAAPDPDRTDSAAPSGQARPEEDPGDAGNRADEGPDSIEWMAARPSRPGRSSSSQWAASITIRPSSALAGRPARSPFATIGPDLGLSVGLCRLLL